MATPTADDLAAYLGRTFTTAEQDHAEAVIGVVASQVFSYVRGVGFSDGDPDQPNDELANVILTASCRQMSNPTNVVREEMGGLVVQHPAPGYSIPELFVLNGFRQRAE